MPCAICHRDIAIVAREMCRACYQRWHKRGTTEYAEKRARNFCQIDACGKPVVSNGMCDTHRKRFERHGHAEQTRADDWGTKKPKGKNRHPLYNAWAWLRRHHARHPMASDWYDDFLQFVADLGERPSKKHKLFSADESKPIGPTNYVWKEAITQRVAGEDERTSNSRRLRVYRAVSPESFAAYDLKKHYGMSRADYETLAMGIIYLTPVPSSHRASPCGLICASFSSRRGPYPQAGRTGLSLSRHLGSL